MRQIVRFMTAPGGARVAFAEAGAGPWLVCPAWWVSHVERDAEHPGFSAFFEALATRFRVVRYDRPGVGLSDRDVPRRTFHDEIALLEALIDHLSAERVALFGVSSGGPVAVAYAAAHPKRVGRMCLFGSYLQGSDVAAGPTRAALVALVRAHWGLGSAALADLFIPGATSEELAWLRRSQRAWSDGDRAAELLELTYEMDVARLAARVRASAVVMHRSGDRAIPLEAGRNLAAALPDARLEVLEGDAHPPWFGAPVADRVLAALGAEPIVSPHTGASPTGSRLDRERRALLVGGEHVPLTRLEFEVLDLLVAARGRVVTRDELLAAAWRQPFAGSNKVDVVMRSLRRKLGSGAAAIETVTGHGYRFAGWT